jgi:hypothetical protein
MQHSLFLPYFTNLINHFWKIYIEVRGFIKSVSYLLSLRQHEALWNAGDFHLYHLSG